MKSEWKDRVKKLVQSQHPEKMISFARKLDDGVIAALYGMDTEAYLGIKQELKRQARDAAGQLLEDRAFADRVGRLPFKPGDLVIGLGESTTDDLLSWLEILRHLLELRRPQDGIRVVNEGISGNTTAQVLGRMNGITALQPDWILCMIGGNDALRIGPEPTKTQVSIEETAKNLEAIRHLAAVGTQAKWVWITPPTLNEEQCSAYPHFQKGQLVWRNEDVLAIGEIIMNLPDTVVDIQMGFGIPAAPHLMGHDGLHPSIEGHKAIVTWIVETLTGGREG